MPRHHRQIQPLADQAEALALVVDQRFHRRHIQHHAMSVALVEARQQGQEGRLRLAGCGCCGYHHVPPPFENQRQRSGLGIA